MPKISVIVPVYRTEKYLCRCIDSILGQTFQDIELILIDDGSPDRCPEICEWYMQRDDRIRVVHQKNAGVAAARNTGLDVAMGDYFAFVDSDDWIASDMYQRMMDKAEEYDCDVVMCDCIKDFADKSELYSHDIRSGYYDKEQLVREYYPHLIMMENVEYPPTISNCLCLFRQRQYSCPNKVSQQKIKGDSLRYIEGVRYSEDLLFGAQLMYRACSFYYMKDQAYYHYCMNSESATHTFVPDKWKDYIMLYEEAERYFIPATEFDFRHQIDLMLLFFVYNAVNDITKSTLPQEQRLDVIQEILKDHRVRDMFHRLSIRKLPISIKLKLRTILYKYQIGQSSLMKYMDKKKTGKLG